MDQCQSIEVESNPLERHWRERCAPQERLSLPEFARKYVVIGAERAPFDLHLFPWLREPMEVMTDYRFPMQAQIIAAQLGKGRSAEAAIPFFIVNDPGDLTWFGRTNDTAKEYAEQRIMPLLKACDPVKPYLPPEEKKVRNQSILMAHMVFEVLGANATNTQSRTRRIIFCDEAWQWEPGMLASAIARTSAPNLIGRRKIIITSTAGEEDCDLERYWETCDQRCWHAACPVCKKSHPFALSRDQCRRVPSHVPVFSLKWDSSETTRPGGVWNYELVKKTVRLVCPSCESEFNETPEVLRSMRESGHYVAMNPLASKERVGFWCPRIPAGEWASIVERFLKCNEERKNGFEDNLREFMLKDLAEKWVVGGTESIDVHPTGDYEISNPPEEFIWEKEHARFMAVDRQALAPYFWYSVEAWSINGESRRVEVGHCDTKEEVEAIAERHGLVGTKSIQVGVDAGFESDDTWAWCAANRWYAFRGDEALGYRHATPGKPTVIRYYSKPQRRVVGVGTRNQGKVFCIEFMWSNPSIKNVLNRLKGGSGIYYGIARNIPKFYLEHMDSEYRKAFQVGQKTVTRFVQRGKRPNHLWDTSCICLVSAFMAGLIRIQEVVEQEVSTALEIEKVT